LLAAGTGVAAGVGLWLVCAVLGVGTALATARGLLECAAAMSTARRAIATN
jgi:hypothetical protein